MTSFEVRSSKAEEPRNRCGLQVPARNRKLKQPSILPAGNSRQSSDWEEDNKRSILQPLRVLVCVLRYNWQQNGDVIWFSSFGKKTENFVKQNGNIKDLLYIYKPVPLNVRQLGV